MTDIKRVAIRKRAVDLLQGLTRADGSKTFRTVSSDLFRDLKPEELPLANIYWRQEVEDEEQSLYMENSAIYEAELMIEMRHDGDLTPADDISEALAGIRDAIRADTGLASLAMSAYYAGSGGQLVEADADQAIEMTEILIKIQYIE